MVYVWGWLVCIVATLGALACGFRFTRSWRPLLLRDAIRVFAVTSLLVPVTAGSYDGFFAPAYIVLVFEAFLQPGGDPIPALSALTLAWGGGLVVLVMLTLWRRLRGNPADA